VLCKHCEWFILDACEGMQEHSNGKRKIKKSSKKLSLGVTCETEYETTNLLCLPVDSRMRSSKLFGLRGCTGIYLFCHYICIQSCACLRILGVLRICCDIHQILRIPQNPQLPQEYRITIILWGFVYVSTKN